MSGILVVCTGNICRSPMAEAFLRAALARRLGDLAPPVSSAGVVARRGPAMPESVRAAAERGVDIGAHEARRMGREPIADADLIVAMAAEHRDAVVDAMPEAASKTFTLKEIVRLLDELPPGEGGFDLTGRVARADALRRSGSDGAARDEDVADPLGMPFESYRAVAWELDVWSERLAEGLAGRRSTHAAVSEGE